MAEPQIVSDWAPADQSTNHLELALTDQLIKNGRGEQQVCALRDSHDPSKVIYVTPGQVQSFSRAMASHDTPAGRILASAVSGRTSSSR